MLNKFSVVFVDETEVLYLSYLANLSMMHMVLQFVVLNLPLRKFMLN